jgi:hypothetical protein
MPQQIRVTVRHHTDTQFEAFVTLHYHLIGTARPEMDIDVRRATGFDDSLSSAVCQVLKSEIGAGIQMGLKPASQRGWQVSLVRLGGSIGGETDLLNIPSAGFAVAATLATLQAAGVEDLEAKPRGGFDWDMVSIQVDDS